MLPNVDFILQKITGKSIMNPGFNVGCFNWILSVYLKIKDVAMIGMEHAYPDGTKITKTQKFRSRVEIIGGKVIDRPDGDIEVEFPCSTCNIPPDQCTDGKMCLEKVYDFFFRGHNDFFNTDYLSDGGFGVMALAFKQLFKQYREDIEKKTGDKITLTNCSPLGILHGDGIEQDYLENWIDKYAKA